VLSASINSYVATAGPNLVPEKPVRNGNYWCTWYAQNYWIGRGTDLQSLKRVTNTNARDELTYDTVFNTRDGWAATYLPRGRGDYIFLIDHGWQTKVPEERIAGGGNFFNLVADVHDFPQYAELEPKKRLKVFNEEIKALGWESLGLWTRGNIKEEEARTFVEWSKYAGIRYWKVDGGDTIDRFYSFKAKEEIYPELMIEYITGAGGNLNQKWNEPGLAEYPSVYDFGYPTQKKMLEVLQHSDTFRTYDAAPLQMSSTTLRRTHDILKQTQQQPKYRAILNVQDDCNTAVGLGVLVASKRHPNMGERTYKGRDLHHQLSGKRMMQKRINEAERFGRWARIAPAFAAGEGTYLSSDRELVDVTRYTEWDTWNKGTYGKVVSQSAPAIMARNMPLPKVEIEGEPPFVCATTYPNGPLGIATEGRVSLEDQWYHPRAKVTVQVKDAAQPIGIVGHYDALVLEFDGSLAGVQNVWAQDLLADEAADIKNEVTIQGNTLIIQGVLIDRIGTSAGNPGDISAPGMVLRLQGKSLPVAGNRYTPLVKPVVAPVVKPVETQETVIPKVFSGTAKVAGNPYGVKVMAPNTKDFAFALKPLQDGISDGKVSLEWKMKPANKASTRNGFLVLSSDKGALASLCAGAWITSGQMTVFEGVGGWKSGPKAKFTPDAEMKCRLDLNMDTRTMKLTINGVTTKSTFTETVTGINYIGFGVKGAETLFTEPIVIRSDS